MEWSNDKIIEFLELFRTEPCLWDPKQKCHKNRGAQAEAWRRIAESLPFQTTTEDLKKKKDALMGYYRIHQNKYKKSVKSAASASDIYTTSWFAYDIMHSFLQPIYGGDITLKIEERDSKLQRVSERYARSTLADENDSSSPFPESESSQVAPSEASESQERSPSPITERASTSRSDMNVSAGQRPSSLRSDEYSGKGFIKNRPSEITARKSQMDETFGYRKSRSQSSHKRSSKLDEYDHFAFMIAAKIRKINDENERETLMNNIQNEVFQSIMRNATTPRNPSRSSSSEANNKDFDIDFHSSNSMSLNDQEE